MRTGNDVFKLELNDTELSNYKFAMTTKLNEIKYNEKKPLNITYMTTLNATEYEIAKTLGL